MANGGTVTNSKTGERKRGRPLKNSTDLQADDVSQGLTVSDNAQQQLQGIPSATTKRKPGRPRSRELPDANAPKRPRGRPPKDGATIVPKAMKPVGRPRSSSTKPTTHELIKQILTTARKQNPPTNLANRDANLIPKKRGRPRTKPPKVTNGIPKKRGRPRLVRPDIVVAAAPLQAIENGLVPDNSLNATAKTGMEPTKKKRGRPPIDPSLYKLPSISPKQIANAAKAAISVGQKKKPGRPPKSMLEAQAELTAGPVVPTTTTNEVTTESTSAPFAVSTTDVVGTTLTPMSIYGTVPQPTVQHQQPTTALTAMPTIAKRGRPKKTVDPSVATAATTPKRGRGRPPKNALPALAGTNSNVIANVPVEVPAVLVQEMPLIAYNITMTTTVEGSTAALAVTPAMGTSTIGTNEVTVGPTVIAPEAPTVQPAVVETTQPLITEVAATSTVSDMATSTIKTDETVLGTSINGADSESKK
jgi:AT hook motif